MRVDKKIEKILTPGTFERVVLLLAIDTTKETHSHFRAHYVKHLKVNSGK